MLINKEKIDWSNPKDKISEHFTVGEATYLPSWDTYHIPSDIEKENILKTAEKMELIREFLNSLPIHIHCWIRPKIVNSPKSHYHAKNYNAAVGGAPGSAHPEGLAVDFHVSKMTCSEVRAVLQPKLVDFDIRMEDINSEGWVHIDLRKPLPKKSRFFKP
jgi:hypothetical protein